MEIKGRRATIGVVINTLDTDYQYAIWDGVEESARRLDVNVVFFEGGSLDCPFEYERYRNQIYSRISPSRIDGLLIAATTLSGFASQDDISRRFIGMIEDIPAVCIGKDFPSVPSVFVNNRAGLDAVIEHLIVAHGRKKFLFMGGFERESDNIERLGTFRAVLARHGLEPVEDGIIFGEYRDDIAMKVLASWLDEHGASVGVDAVVAANDTMAFGCYDVLSSRGYDVPLDVSLTGFDDSPSARNFTIPLTTVIQPVREIASRALETLAGMMVSGGSAANVELESEPVIRQSCGCLSPDVLGADLSWLPAGTDSGIPGIDVDEQLSALEEAFLRVLRKEREPSEFLVLFRSSLLKSRAKDTARSFAWNGFVTRLGLIGRDGPDPRASESLVHQARIMINEFAESAQATSRIRDKCRNHFLLYSVADIVSSFSLESLFDRLANTLPLIGIQNCYFSLFVPETGLLRSRLRLCLQNGRSIALPPDGIEFDTDDLVPAPILGTERRHSLVTELLFHDNAVLGIIAMELPRSELALGDTLTRQIRGSLRSSLMLDELVEKDARLNAAFDQLSTHAFALERANEMIRQKQEQLVSSERMASLGRLTAGIAHEMNTPLAAVRASLSELDKLVVEYGSSMEDPEVSPDDHRAIASEMSRAVALASSATERAASFIQSIKGQTRDRAIDAIAVPFDACAVIRDVTVLLGHVLRKERISVAFDLPGGKVTLMGIPGRLAQVMTNLMVNAIDAMKPAGGTIAVSLRRLGGEIAISVADSGCGIAPDSLPRVFDALFTTKPFGVGTGLGLSIVKDIVTGDFGGRIDVESAPGKGSVFTVTLPREKGEPDAQEISAGREVRKDDTASR